MILRVALKKGIGVGEIGLSNLLSRYFALVSANRIPYSTIQATMRQLISESLGGRLFFNAEEGTMNLKYLGDALDHWKGSLLECLREMDALRNFAVDPMANDLTSWTPDDYGVFVRLMRISRKELIEHHTSLVNRTAYFEEISHPGDLFLDPDTGIATGRVKDQRCYVFPQEIGRLLDTSTGHLRAIYQHVRAQSVTHRLNEVLGTLERLIGSFSWCSYESGNVAMLFLSRDPARTQRVADCFGSVLGRHAPGRIRSSTAAAQQKL